MEVSAIDKGEGTGARGIADIALLVLLSPVLVPVAALIALAVYLDSPGPVLFRARRVGRDGQEFDMPKFRTMVRDASGPSVSARGDARYTPLGRFLSRSRLDELPQLLLVLRGEMRLVGPRPEARVFVDAHAEEYREILSVPPGLTGPTQVAYAWEGEVLAAAEEHDRDRLYREEILPMKVLLDLEYVRRRNALSDLAILIATLLLPLRQLGLASGLAAGAHGRNLPRLLQTGALVLAVTLTLALFVLDGRAAI
jgi:lipopolysaccharide/colanic/teichoic acid biosynthesis glycosyltransferase